MTSRTGEGRTQKSEVDCTDEAYFFLRCYKSLFFPTHIKCLSLLEIPFILMASPIHPIAEVEKKNPEIKNKTVLPLAYQMALLPVYLSKQQLQTILQNYITELPFQVPNTKFTNLPSSDLKTISTFPYVILCVHFPAAYSPILDCILSHCLFLKPLLNIFH